MWTQTAGVALESGLDVGVRGLDLTPPEIHLRPPVIGAEESCRAGTCPTICCEVSEDDRSQLARASRQNSSYSLDENSTSLEPTPDMSDVRDNQIGYSPSSEHGSLGPKRNPSDFPTEEERRANSRTRQLASQRRDGQRRLHFPAGQMDVTNANDALSGSDSSQFDWSKRKGVEKKTTPSSRWRSPNRFRSSRRRVRTGRSVHPGFGYIEQLQLNDYPELVLDERYCAPDVPEFENCLRGIGANFTFYIPVSKHMTRQMLHLQMRYSEQHALSPAPVQCRSPSARERPQACAEQDVRRSSLSQPLRSGSLAGKPNFVLPLDVGRWRYKSYKFRIANEHFPDLNACRVSSTFVQSHFYEYNLIFERQCDE